MPVVYITADLPELSLRAGDRIVLVDGADVAWLAREVPPDIVEIARLIEAAHARRASAAAEPAPRPSRPLPAEWPPSLLLLR